MSWASVYVGLPYRDLGRDRAGCDCWGLVRLVYLHELGIELPSYAEDYVSAAEHAEIARLIGDVEEGDAWREIEMVRPFDVAVFTRGVHRSHVGVMVDGAHMLHMAGRSRAVIEPIDRPRHASRLAGFHRHVLRMGVVH